MCPPILNLQWWNRQNNCHQAYNFKQGKIGNTEHLSVQSLHRDYQGLLVRNAKITCVRLSSLYSLSDCPDSSLCEETMALPTGKFSLVSSVATSEVRLRAALLLRSDFFWYRMIDHPWLCLMPEGKESSPVPWPHWSLNRDRMTAAAKRPQPSDTVAKVRLN